MPKGKTELARAIRQLRGDLSQQDFAHELGVGIVSISRYEHGATPDVSVLRRLYQYAVQQNDDTPALALAREITQRIGMPAGEHDIGLSNEGKGVLREFIRRPGDAALQSKVETVLRESIHGGDSIEQHEKVVQWWLALVSMQSHLPMRISVPDDDPSEPRVHNEYERRIVREVLRFLRDANTSDREREILEFLILERGN